MIIIVEAICAFFSCFFFAIIYNTPKSELNYCGLIGGIGYVIYFIFVSYLGQPMCGSFLGTASICILSKYFSAKHRMPKLLYVLPAIFPIVPGAGIYYALHGIMIGDFSAATYQGIDAFKTIGTVVLAMLIILPDLFFKFSRIKNDEEGEETE